MFYQRIRSGCTNLYYTVRLVCLAVQTRVMRATK